MQREARRERSFDDGRDGVPVTSADNPLPASLPFFVAVLAEIVWLAMLAWLAWRE